MMVDNYFRCDQLRIRPCQFDVRVVCDFGKPFEQIGGLLGCTGKPPEVGWSLEGDANHVPAAATTALGMGAFGRLRFFRLILWMLSVLVAH